MGSPYHCDWGSHWEQVDCDDSFSFPYGSNDEEYEQVSEECTDSKCLGKMEKCPNWMMCHRSHPKGLLGCWGGRCLNCDITFGQNLVFKESCDECPICLEPIVGYGMVFPKCPRGHLFCIDCVCFTIFGTPGTIAKMKEVLADSDSDADPHELAENFMQANSQRSKLCPLCRHPAW